MGEQWIRRVMVLGSVPSLGPVMLFDDIEDLLKWSKTGTGADYVVEKSATVAYNGSACLHMQPKATSPADGDVVSAYRDLYQRPGKRYRVEMIWRFEVETTLQYARFSQTIWDGTNKHEVEVRFDAIAQKWQYLNSGGTWSDVIGGAQRLNNVAWHRMMIEFDESAGEFIQLVSDSLEMSLSGIKYKQAGDGVPVRYRSLVEIENTAAGRAEVYLDDYLVMEI